MKSLAEVVAESPVFAGMAKEHLELLAGCAQNVHFADGRTIVREGEPADVFYLVRHGAVALDTFVPGRGPVTIETVHEGDLVGWSWLFPPYRWHFDARAMGSVAAVAIDGACMRGKCASDRDFGYELMLRISQVMLDRLQATRLRLLDVYGHVPR
jgi:CRP/FNR family cyclic AMP-dependent transcriptional regulator